MRFINTRKRKNMDAFKKKGEQQYLQEGLFIENRQLGWLLSGLCIFGFMLFYGGYFLGKKRGLMRHAYYEESRGEGTMSLDSVLLSTTNKDIETSRTEKDSMSDLESNSMDAVFDNAMSAFDGPRECHYAHLAAFNSQTEAQECANRLRERNVSVRIMKRSVNLAGSNEDWYQVTTDLFEDKDELVAIVGELIKKEKLRDIYYVCC